MKLKTYQLFNSKTSIFLVFMLVFTGLSLKAQVKLGGNWSSANPNAVLDLEASDKGLLLPRVSTATRSSTLANAPAGLVVYDTDLNRLMIKQGPDAASWAALSMSATLPDTLKGLVGIYNSGLVGNNSSPVLRVTNGSTGIQGNRLADFTRPIATAGGKSVLLLGKDANNKNAAWFSYTHAGDNNNNNQLSIGFPGREDVFSINAKGAATFLDSKDNSFWSSERDDKISITNFYHWNTSDEIGVNNNYGQKLRLGTLMGPDKNTAIAQANHYVDLDMFLTTNNVPQDTWVNNFGIKLKDSYYFLKYGSDQKLILGKGDQANKTMLIHATGYTRLGVVSIGHQNPDVSALLDLNFTGTSDDLGKGLLLPRYSTTTLNDNNFYQPATGLLAFDQTKGRVVMNAGTPAARNWQPMVLGNADSVTLTGLSTNVSNPNVKANSIIILTAQDGGTASFSVSNKAAGSFTINTSADGSSKTVGYLIIN